MKDRPSIKDWHALAWQAGSPGPAAARVKQA